MKEYYKDGEKIVNPFFPRLHINDSDRRGPRAPPRNKMALYEHITVPSQRLNTESSSSSSSLITIPPNKVRNFPFLVPNQVMEKDWISSSSISAKPHEPLESSSHRGDKACINLNERSQSTVYQTSDSTSQLRVKGNKYFLHPPKIPIPMKFRDFNDRRVRYSSHNNKNGDAILENASSDSVMEESASLNNTLLEERQAHALIKTRIIQHSTSLESRKKIENVPSRSENRACKSPNEEQFRFIQSDKKDEIGDKINFPDDVSSVLGPRTFLKARKAIINQWRIFNFQLFELHRILKVQNSISILLDISLFSKKLTLKRPPISKTDLQKPYPILPFYYHQPQINQWVVPVMSYSDGPIYETRSKTPETTLMKTDPFSPTPYGISPIDQNIYFPPFGAIPILTPSVSSSPLEHVSPSQKHSSNGTKDSQPKMEHSTKRVVNELQLFPTTPTLVSEKENSETSQVIKVIPHNPKSGSESVSRIFKYIQEEKMKND